MLCDGFFFSLLFFFSCSYIKNSNVLIADLIEKYLGSSMWHVFQHNEVALCRCCIVNFDVIKQTQGISNNTYSKWAWKYFIIDVGKNFVAKSN